MTSIIKTIFSSNKKDCCETKIQEVQAPTSEKGGCCGPKVEETTSSCCSK